MRKKKFRYNYCRHRKRIALMTADYVEFTPDEEKSGVRFVELDLNMYFCLRCKQVVGIEVEDCRPAMGD